MSNGMITANELSPPESETGCCPTPPSSAISEHSTVTGTPQHIREWLMSSQGDFRASRFPSQESKPEQTTPATCGPQQSSASAWYDHDTHSWKTYQASLLADISHESWETWPKAGMIAAGVFYPQPKWERRISVIGSGLHVPTPTVTTGAQTAENPTPGQTGGTSLSGWVKMFPTPTDPSKGGGSSRSEDRDNETPSSLTLAVRAEEVIGGKLNPVWVEWLMGWPLGASGLRPLATAKYRSWLRQHGGC